ncbi:MAG TPA: mechanosensitive ion channel domain-containing protein [Acidimicrobiales bacterium]|nr:mechanosensitive ion channel domain-containing protein [Acidimicrobiales bacterium]
MIAVLAAAETPRQEVLARELTAADWIAAGVILVVGLAASAALRTVLGRSLKRGDSERSAADLVAKGLGWLVVAAALFWSLALLGLRVGPLFGALGIGGLAVAFAAQSILANFLAAIILQVRKPFRRGDQISTNDCEGTVEGINFRTVALRTYDGERVMVPCADVLSRPIVNHTTLGRRRTTLEVGVAFDTDLEKARKLLLDRVQHTDGVLERPPCEVWVKEFDESAVTLAVRYWHPPDIASLWRVRSHVAVGVKSALDEAGIEIPFPRRIIGFIPEAVPHEPGGADGADVDGRQASSSAKGTSG